MTIDGDTLWKAGIFLALWLGVVRPSLRYLVRRIRIARATMRAEDELASIARGERADREG